MFQVERELRRHASALAPRRWRAVLVTQRPIGRTDDRAHAVAAPGTDVLCAVVLTYPKAFQLAFE